MKRITKCMLLTAILTLIFAFPVFADTPIESWDIGGYPYDATDVTAKLYYNNGTDATDGYNLAINCLTTSTTFKMKSYGSAETVPWHTYRSQIKSVTFNGTLATIETYAFQDCTALTSITIPSGTTAIGKYAFQGCSNLVSVFLPDTIKTIKMGAFMDCSKLALSELPSGLESIETYAFYSCSKLNITAIPQGTKEIGSYAFNECTSIQSLTIPSSVTFISGNAFFRCNNMKYLILNSVTLTSDYNLTVKRYRIDGSEILTLAAGETYNETLYQSPEDVPIRKMLVTATVSSSYILTVPAIITLTPYDNPYGSEFDYNYWALDKIGCKGDILPSQYIEIRMDGNLKKTDTLQEYNLLVIPEYDEHRFSNNPRDSLAHAINKNTFNYIDVGVYAKIIDAGQYEGEATFEFYLH